jgi:Fe2+ or Zn2+ uptake regulation protein
MKRSDTQDISQLRDAFRSAGTRLTPQRSAVWRLFTGDPAGFSIAGAAAKLKSKGIGLATVYRTVSLLEKLDFLRHVHDEGLEHRFVATQPGHRHSLVCRSCGKVVEFEACDLSVVERLLKAETGFRVEGHYLEIYGTCATCAGGSK